MIDLEYSLVIEATEEPDYFGFYSPDLEGFTGIGHSIEDCIYKAKWRMKEHVKLLTQLSELKKCSIFSANYKIELRKNSIFRKRSKQLLIAKN